MEGLLAFRCESCKESKRLKGFKISQELMLTTSVMAKKKKERKKKTFKLTMTTKSNLTGNQEISKLLLKAPVK